MKGDIDITGNYLVNGQPISTDLAPLTLDKVNNRVGINTTSPPAETLDVAGNVNVTGNTATGTLRLETIANSSKSNVLMYDTTTKEVSYGAPTPDIHPITLDQTNNRVGINFVNPSYTLGVGGDANLATGGVYRINGFPLLALVGTNTSVAVGRTDTIPAASGNAVAIGSGANAGNQSVSIGLSSGKTTQGDRNVAIGSQAGQYTQGSQSVAIGYGSGQGSTTAGTGQGSNAVAIGTRAGKLSQGNSSIAIGWLAGETNQHANSVILNSTGTALNSTHASSFYVKPIRSVVDPSLHSLSYNNVTGEICYGGPHVWELSATDQHITVTPAYYLVQELPAGKYIATVRIVTHTAAGTEHVFKMIAGAAYAAEDIMTSLNGLTHTMTACFDRSSTFTFQFECYLQKTTVQSKITLSATIMRL